MKHKVICVHIGARAHYLIPKALQLKGNLSYLITDTWIASAAVRSRLAGSPVRMVKSFASRYSAAIPANAVKSFSFKFLAIEVMLRAKRLKGWDLIIARNNYFESIAENIFRKLPSTDSVLGISYTSHKVFKVAGQRKQKKILFQIDPGLKEEHIVADIVARYGDVYTTNWEPAPASYWNAWREECTMADVIMANSIWSKDALIEEGIEEQKIKVVPLPFQIEKKHNAFKKEYPVAFNKERPMRCLFLGTLTLRKGVHIVLEVASRLVNAPIEFIMVGQNELDMKLLDKPNVQYKGVASRADTDAYYQSSDVFLFPTLSDGFGLTQLEAMAWQLPVIASKHCGEVVVNQVNGLELDTCDADTLEKALMYCLEHPETLKKTASNCLETVKQFSLENFADSLAKLTE